MSLKLVCIAWTVITTTLTRGLSLKGEGWGRSVESLGLQQNQVVLPSTHPSPTYRLRPVLQVFRGVKVSQKIDWLVEWRERQGKGFGVGVQSGRLVLIDDGEVYKRFGDSAKILACGSVSETLRDKNKTNENPFDVTCLEQKMK